MLKPPKIGKLYRAKQECQFTNFDQRWRPQKIVRLPTDTVIMMVGIEADKINVADFVMFLWSDRIFRTRWILGAFELYFEEAKES